jgi:hypothetical protein
MASSPVEIVNQALLRLGLEVIESLDDDTPRARAAKRMYDQTRDDLLRLAPWNFAQRRVELAQLASNPAWGDLFAYQLPSDCLMVLETSLEAADPWRIEGRTLVTQAAAVSILYVASIADPSQYDPNFTEALIDRLAFLLSYPLTRNATLADALMRKAEDTLRKAKSRDGQEGRPLTRFLSDAFTQVR